MEEKFNVNKNHFNIIDGFRIHNYKYTIDQKKFYLAVQEYLFKAKERISFKSCLDISIEKAEEEHDFFIVNNSVLIHEMKSENDCSIYEITGLKLPHILLEIFNHKDDLFDINFLLYLCSNIPIGLEENEELKDMLSNVFASITFHENYSMTINDVKTKYENGEKIVAEAKEKSIFINHLSRFITKDNTKLLRMN